MERKTLYATEDGTPQGGIISPVLANLALDGLERVLATQYPHKGRGSAGKINLIRYADDFVITGSSRELLEREVLPLVSTFMAERGLELSAEKTLITPIEDGFDFLGQNIRKYSGKLIIKPSAKNVKVFLDNLRGVVKANKSSTAGELIQQLNPKIRGWANYHQHICSAGTFQYVDHVIFQMLWRWAVRRHRNKSRRWIKDKYYTHVPGPLGGNNWQFFGAVQSLNRPDRTVMLRRACQTRIRRHTKIREQVNPYHPRWQKYLTARHARRKKTAPEGDADDNIAIVQQQPTPQSTPTR
jgi:RNA-directed DNA polymerase